MVHRVSCVGSSVNRIERGEGFRTTFRRTILSRRVYREAQGLLKGLPRGSSVCFGLLWGSGVWSVDSRCVAWLRKRVFGPCTVPQTYYLLETPPPRHKNMIKYSSFPGKIGFSATPKVYSKLGELQL